MDVDDIRNWDTTAAYPILFASACSFASMDDPFFVSGAERAVLCPQGGCIAAIGGTDYLTTGRIEKIQTDFLLKLLDRDETFSTLGAVYLYAKRENADRKSSRFVFIGDPGLKKALPKHVVITDSINGKQWKGGDTLQALTYEKIAGSIRGGDGDSVLRRFNGFLQYKVFAPSCFLQRDNRQEWDGETPRMIEYESQETVLATGHTEVKDGRFEITFLLSEAVKEMQGRGKLTYYAYSEEFGDAVGYDDSFYFGGTGDGRPPVSDIQPPRIVSGIVYKEEYMNGDWYNVPYCRAKISDHYGLDITESDYGHRLILKVEGKSVENASVYFCFYPGSLQEGILEYPLLLPEGRYEIEIEVWNIFGLSSLSHLWFDSHGYTDNEEREVPMDFIQTTPRPNPATTGYADFYFSALDPSFSSCEMEVFDAMGRKLVSRKFDLKGSINPVLHWDWRKTELEMNAGIYLCRFSFSKSGGKNNLVTYCKLVVLE